MCLDVLSFFLQATRDSLAVPCALEAEACDTNTGWTNLNNGMFLQQTRETHMCLTHVIENQHIENQHIDSIFYETPFDSPHPITYICESMWPCNLVAFVLGVVFCCFGSVGCISFASQLQFFLYCFRKVFCLAFCFLTSQFVWLPLASSTSAVKQCSKPFMNYVYRIIMS